MWQMTDSWKPAQASDVVVGDVVRIPSGTVLTVTRIESGFLGTPMIAFVEDTAQRWFKCPQMADAPVEIHTKGD